MKRIVLIAAAVVAYAMPAAVQAAPVAKEPSGSVTLRSHSTGRAPGVKTRFRLPRGVWYVARVSGTMSWYSPIDYAKPRHPYNMVCGHPQMVHGLPVGVDAEFVFARPWTTLACAQARLPSHWRNFQTLGAGGWVHPQTLGKAPAAPSARHVYRYVLRGRNRVARFRVTDSYYADDYGALTISLRPATTADCRNFASFGFASAAVCARSLPRPTRQLKRSATTTSPHRPSH